MPGRKPSARAGLSQPVSPTTFVRGGDEWAVEVMPAREGVYQYVRV